MWRVDWLWTSLWRCVEGAQAELGDLYEEDMPAVNGVVRRNSSRNCVGICPQSTPWMVNPQSTGAASVTYCSCQTQTIPKPRESDVRSRDACTLHTVRGRNFRECRLLKWFAVRTTLVHVRDLDRSANTARTKIQTATSTNETKPVDQRQVNKPVDGSGGPVTGLAWTSTEPVGPLGHWQWCWATCGLAPARGHDCPRRLS